ncbi:MAG: hypothetical protein WC506_00155 [Candidatus Micrarchaeia archaeon]
MNSRKSSKPGKGDEPGILDVNAKALAVSAALAMLTVLLVWLYVGATFPSGNGGWGNGYGMMGGYGYGMMNGNSGGFLTAAVLLNVINVVVLAFLIAQYITMYMRIKSEFTLGLIVLAYVLMAHSIMSSPVMFTDVANYGAAGSPLALMRAIFTTIAAGVLLYLNAR